MRRSILALSVLSACGTAPAVDGTPGAAGADGLACWDLNGDGIAGGNEDRNGDGAWDAADCHGDAAEVTALEETITALQAQLDDLTATVDAQDDRIAELESACLAEDDLGDLLALTEYLVVETEEIRLVGANVYVQSGSGSTDDDGSITGLGNLIIGYDEDNASDKTGAHNLVLGTQNSYSGIGGIVAGRGNTISGSYAAVVGGTNNLAAGEHSAVVGGAYNEASGDQSTVAGGASGLASGLRAAVSGGRYGTASGSWSTVSSGSSALASDSYSID